LIHAELFECALRDRVFSLPANRNKRSWIGVFFSSGSGIARWSAEEQTLSSNSLIWVPWTLEITLTISAGSVGQYFSVSENTLSNAIGHNTGSPELRLLADRFASVQFSENDPALLDVEHAFGIIQRETRSRAIGSVSMAEAHLRVILVLLLRCLPQLQTETSGAGRTAAILHSFRQLVETHFRDHWSIGAYASEVGISPDRLHDLCTRNLSKTPRQLVHERTVYEARRMLEMTTLTVDQLSGLLGFRDPTYFSRFFKARVGLPPASFRRNHLLRKSRQASGPTTDFADWP